MRKCKVGIIGISGFGSEHLRVVKQLEEKGMLELRAVCDVQYDRNKEQIDGLTARGVKYYSDYLQMLQNEKGLDFISIATPIHLHRRMSIDAMKAGFNVLLEKPPAVTIQDMDEIIRTSEETGKLCGVEFTTTSMKALLVLLDEVAKGRLGEIRNVSGAGLWQKLDDYYARTPWAGKLLINSNYVLDGTVNNPLAHVLNNMLLIARTASSGKSYGNVTVSAVTAELYHGHDISGEDTSCVRVEMNNGIMLHFYATLCHTCYSAPYIIVEGTEGKALWNYNNDLEITCGGRTEKVNYGKEDNVELMFANMYKVITGEEKKLYCPVEAARDFVLASNGAFESSGDTHAVASEYIARFAEDGSTATCIKDIQQIIENAMSQRLLFSEADVPWAVPGKRFSLEDYSEFNKFK